ncbi:MAG: TPM domain-containing protein [Candidatus Aenigmatarchaeota archaeon]
MKRAVVLLLIISIALATDAPKSIGYVNDYAGILDNKDILESMLVEMERNSSVEFAIVTLTALPSDETMETYAYKILTTWGIGKKDEDNGLLLLIIANGTPGNRMRIELGYGMEGYITDATAGRILDDALPYYENGDYSQAAYIIVSEVMSVLEGKYIPIDSGMGSWDDGIVFDIIILITSLFPFILFGIFMIIAIIFAKPKCPTCGSRKLESNGDYYICKFCKRKFKKKKARKSSVFFAGFGGGGFGGSGGGFGGGSGGGGGAGR